MVFKAKMVFEIIFQNIKGLMGCTGSRPKPRNTQGSSTAAGKADVTQKVENSAA